MSWEPINLAAPEFAQPSRPPFLCGLVYDGGRHVISGPPESAKTVLAYILALEYLRANTTQALVAHVDFEMGPVPARTLLDELGATLDEIGRILYYEPGRPPVADDIAYIVDNGAGLAIIDAAAGAYDVSNLDDNKRQDAEMFARAWIRPLWDHGIPTILLDHVTKNSDNRGKFTIGSERKIGQADVHLGLEAITPLRRGSTGLFRIATHKDRFGHLPRPRAAELRLDSDPITHAITWTFQAPAETSNGWKPTVLMEKVSGFLAEQPEPVSRAAIERAVKGKRAEYVRAAIDALIADGYAAEGQGSRTDRAVRHIKPFTSSDLVPTSSDELASTSSTSSPAYRRDEDRDEDEVEVDPGELNYYESIIDADLLAEAERLAERHADLM